MVSISGHSNLTLAALARIAARPARNESHWPAFGI